MVRSLTFVLSGLSSATLAVMLIITLYTATLLKGWHGAGPSAAATLLLVDKGGTLDEVARQLEAAGTIASARNFKTVLWLAGLQGEIKAGEFRFAAGASASEVAQQLREGSNVRRRITIPEGWTVVEAIARLRATEGLVGSITEPPAEGTILPGTYFFQRGSERGELLQTMISHHRQALQQAWSQRAHDTPLTSANELLVLASIVEKETQIEGERSKVARAFINRLHRKMPLQADPTVIYALTQGKRKLGRELLRADLSYDSPYNTYRYRGLPPTPIANPSRAAMEAVANPQAGDQIFFVADGSGGHVFAATYEEHKKNVASYRKYQQQQRAKTTGDNSN